MLLGEGCLQRRARKDHIMYQNIFCRALKWTSIADRLKISNKCRVAGLWLLFFFLHLKVFPRVGKMWLFIRRCEGWNVIWLSPAIAPRIWGAVETQKYYPHENIFTASLKLISFNNWVLNSWSTNYGCKWKYLFVFDNILIRVESCHLSRCLSIIASMFPRFSVVFKLYSTLEIFILISNLLDSGHPAQCNACREMLKAEGYLLSTLHNTWTADLRELGVGNVQRYKMLLELRGMPSWTHGKFFKQKMWTGCGRNMTTCPYI